MPHTLHLLNLCLVIYGDLPLPLPPQVSNIICILWMHIPSSLGFTFSKPRLKLYIPFNNSRVWLNSNLDVQLRPSNLIGVVSFNPFLKTLKIMASSIELFVHTHHHQNGVVERKHRHIVDIRLTLPSQSSFPLTY